MADIHRLLEIDQFACIAQSIEKLPEIFLHCVSFTGLAGSN
jgi:hypothetical protein